MSHPRSKLVLFTGVSVFVLQGFAVAQTASTQAEGQTGPTQAASQTAPAQADNLLEEVRVTGSRVISNGNDSPTPVTVLTTDQIQAVQGATARPAN
jgi:iron complex outermembrane receptor protein